MSFVHREINSSPTDWQQIGITCLKIYVWFQSFQYKNRLDIYNRIGNTVQEALWLGKSESECLERRNQLVPWTLKSLIISTILACCILIFIFVIILVILWLFIYYMKTSTKTISYSCWTESSGFLLDGRSLSKIFLNIHTNKLFICCWKHTTKINIKTTRIVSVARTINSLPSPLKKYQTKIHFKLELKK